MKTLTSLLERLNLDPEVLEACARNAEALGLPLERALYEAERINENQYLETAAARHAMPCELRLAALMDKEGSGWATDAERVCKVPLPWLRKQKVVPVRDKDGKLALAICHPSGWLLAQELGMLLGERLERPVLAREDDITDIINRIFGESTRSEGSVSDVLGDSVNAIDEFNEDAVEDLLEDSSEAPFIRLVNMILAQAVRAGASDIHIEPYRDVSRVRFRLDGVLYERHTLNKAHHAAVVSRIKVMAKLNIAEKRLPQDGRIAISLGGRQAGLRVSTLPTSFGERVVLRLLEKSERVLSLTELGLSREDLQLMHSLVGITHGIVLVTDEWAYLCGGGCRTLFPWGDGLDYSMRLHWFENMDEDENRPYDMEEPNFFGLSIAYDPYMREVVQADRLTTCGGDGGCNICGGLGPFLGFLPCSPHCKPEVQEDNELNGDYDFYRPIIRLENYD